MENAVKNARLRTVIIIVIILLVAVSLLACQLSKKEATPEVIIHTPTPGGEVEQPAPTPESEEPEEPAPTPEPEEEEVEPAPVGHEVPPGTVIVDNLDAGFSIESGEWGTCEGNSCQGTPYGPDFLFADPTCTDCRVRFELHVEQAGDYDVVAWWPWGEDRSTATIYDIVWGSEEVSVEVDQRNSGDDWFYLGTFNYQPGDVVTVFVNASDTGYANADAIALMPTGTGGEEQPPPETAEGAPVIEYFYSEESSNQGCYYLHWEVHNATDVYLDDTQVEASASTEVCPEETTYYGLWAGNDAGEVEAEVDILVGEGEEVAETEETVAPTTSPAQPPPPPSDVAVSKDTIVIDHTCTDISKIPGRWIEEAKKLTVHFAHTSHGSQLISGVQRLADADPKYGVAVRDWDPAALPEETGVLRIYDGNNFDGDNYITPEMYWGDDYGVDRTRSVAATGLFNVSMWSWCGQQSYDNDDSTVNRYLQTITQLESEFPNMRFVYMTGHADGDSGSSLIHNNEIVRNYAKANGKVLFDFWDIDSYDPDGNYHDSNEEASCLWCESWCASHSGDCANLPYDCAHSENSEAQKFTCKLKGNAFWWMMARLAGWDGVSQ